MQSNILLGMLQDLAMHSKMLPCSGTGAAMFPPTFENIAACCYVLLLGNYVAALVRHQCGNIFFFVWKGVETAMPLKSD